MLGDLLKVAMKTLGWSEGINEFTVEEVDRFESKSGNDILVVRTDIDDFIVNLTQPTGLQAAIIVALVKAAAPELKKEEMEKLELEDLKNLLVGKKFKAIGIRSKNGNIYIDPKSIVINNGEASEEAQGNNLFNVETPF